MVTMMHDGQKIVEGTRRDPPESAVHDLYLGEGGDDEEQT